MFSKLSLSLTAALVLSAAAGVAARATPISAPESGALARSSTSGAINAAESGNPHSVDYGNRLVPRRPLTNDEINALETGNPHSVDDRNRPIPGRSPTSDEIDAAETGNPDSVDNKDR
jgi:hypothetical protein